MANDQFAATAEDISEIVMRKMRMLITLQDLLLIWILIARGVDCSRRRS